LNIFLQDSESRVTEPDAIDNIQLTECKLLWIDIDDPGTSGETIKGADFEIDIPAFKGDDVSAGGPRIQQRASDLLIFWSVPREFDDGSQRLNTVPVLIVLGEHYVVTIHDHVPEVAQVRDDFHRGEYENPLYSILESTAFADLNLAVDVTRDIDLYLDIVLDGGSNKALPRKARRNYDVNEIKQLKRHNVEVRKLVTAHRAVLLRLTRRGTMFMPADLARDLVDIVEEYWRIDDEVASNSDLITASLDIQLNVTMKRLTTIATIFMPLTFIVGLYGMNFRHMPELAWQYGYLYAWISMAVVAVAMIIIARRKGWF